MSLVLAPGTELKGYRLTRHLGRGGFGDVWEVLAPGGIQKAIKFAPMESYTGDLFSREREGLDKIKAIRHPYLLSIEWYDVMDGYLVTCMELADGSLADRFESLAKQGTRGLPREELIHYMRESAEVLDLLADQYSLQHLDIKPGNLFLSAGHVKVADFGLVQAKGSTLTGSALAFSPPYAPPELFDGQVNPTADQYSLAVTYQELLTGSRPYVGTDVRALMFQHIQGKPDVSLLPASERPLIAKALSRDPEQRFASCSEFVGSLMRAVSFGPASVSLGGLKRPIGFTAGQAVANNGTAGGPLGAGGNTKPMFVRAPGVGPVGDVMTQPKTKIVGAVSSRTVVVQEAETVGENGEVAQVRQTFVGFLPLEIFAHKLRGFIDAIGAEIVKCTDENTVLLFRAKGWLGFRSQKGIFLQVNSCARAPNSGYRVLDISVWSSNQHIPDDEMSRKGLMLIQILKSFLMADDGPKMLKSLNQVRAEIFN